MNNFITVYVRTPIYLEFYGFWKVFQQTRWVPNGKADIMTGMQRWMPLISFGRKRISRNMPERVWFWIL